MKKSESVHSIKQLKEYRRKLRKKLTPAEAYLWYKLKSRKFKGKRFTRQHSIKNYIVDFYCAEEKLIVELDGEIHNNTIAQEKDAKRDKELNKLGYVVLRFENKMVFDNLSSVFQEIEDNMNP